VTFAAAASLFRFATLSGASLALLVTAARGLIGCAAVELNIDHYKLNYNDRCRQEKIMIAI
jgi:hypothetical protein